MRAVLRWLQQNLMHLALLQSGVTLVRRVGVAVRTAGEGWTRFERA